jgi:Family of unknown function (DUF6365)
MKDRHLFVSLNPNSWGSAAMARTIADELSAMGDEVVSISHAGIASVMAGAHYRCEVLPEHMGPLVSVALDNLKTELNPTTVVFADYFANANFFYRMGAAPDRLFAGNVATFAIDPWHLEYSGYEVDTTLGRTSEVGPENEEERSWYRRHFESVVHKLKPVPMIRPAASKLCFCTLPESGRFPTAVRGEWRSRLGLSGTDRAVLFCTNGWQHPHSESPLKRMGDGLPRLLAEHILRLGKSAHLVHVGPQPYPLDEQLQGRYHWLPSLAPAEFDALVSSVDLMVSANVSAATIAKAMTLGIPVVVLLNSFSGITSCEVAQLLPERPSAWMNRWIDEVVPLGRFALWPIGFHRFLAPLLKDNPYVRALQVVEILDERFLHKVLAALLYSRTEREEQLHRQAGYLAQIRMLPSGAQAIKAIC